MPQEDLSPPPAGMNPQRLGGAILNETMNYQADAEWPHVLQAARNINERIHNDPKTDLLNETAYVETLGVAINTLRPDQGDELVVVVMDVDGFKAVNDALGHAGGDRLLRLISGVNRSVYSRKSEVGLPDARDDNPENIARLGGDEFAVTLVKRGNAAEDKRITPLEEVGLKQTERANELLQEALKGTEFEAFNLALSAGIAKYKPAAKDESGNIIEPGDTVESLMTRADLAMYENKYRGKIDAIKEEDKPKILEAIPMFERYARVPDWLKEAVNYQEAA